MATWDNKYVIGDRVVIIETGIVGTVVNIDFQSETYHVVSMGNGAYVVKEDDINYA